MLDGSFAMNKVWGGTRQIRMYTAAAVRVAPVATKIIIGDAAICFSPLIYSERYRTINFPLY